MLVALLVSLALAIFGFTVILARAAIANHARPTVEGVILGAVTNFFDTLGIGSFAPTTAWLKFRKLVPDRLIPSTLLVGHGLPTMAESIIFLILLGVKVDAVLLAGCAISVLLGGLMGVSLVTRTRVWVIQLVVAIALLIGAAVYALTNLHLMPGGGTAASLPIGLTILAIAANFIFGVLLNFGVGNYAPTLIMFSLMGMDPRLVFPIMTTGASLTAAAAGARHLAIGQVDFRLVLGIAIGGVPAVFIAALIVKSTPLEALRWLVFIVVIYAAAVMARAAWLERSGHKLDGATVSVAG
jgi:uncharacterized membrane protein YfcA